MVGGPRNTRNSGKTTDWLDNREDNNTGDHEQSYENAEWINIWEAAPKGAVQVGMSPVTTHLMNIGLIWSLPCHIFVRLVATPSHTIQQSCILIGYGPHVKAYCLWDLSTPHIFNLYHVTFTEHLNVEPSPLLPGSTLSIEHASLLHGNCLKIHQCLIHLMASISHNLPFLSLPFHLLKLILLSLCNIMILQILTTHNKLTTHELFPPDLYNSNQSHPLMKH